jgi:hypothetical protein
MGLLVSTRGTRNILDTLNTVFDWVPAPQSGPPTSGLGYLQNYAGTYPNLTQAGQTIFGRQWKVGALADLFGLDPTDQSSNVTDPTDKRRWRFFLKSLPSDIFSRLQNALADAILNVDANGKPLKDPSNTSFSIVRVTFDHVELEDPNDLQVTNPNPNLVPSIVIFDSPLPNPSGGTSLGTVRHITLFTQRVQKSA